MDVFPLFLKLADRPCLVVGADDAALSKAELLGRCRARVTVAADALPPALHERVEAGAVVLRPEAEAAGLLEQDWALAIIALSVDEARAAQLAEKARAARVPVIALDRPAISTATMGALVDRAPLVVAIASGGAAPVLVRHVRQVIERALPERLGRLADFAARFRRQAREAFANATERADFWHGIFTGPVAEAVLEGDEAGAERGLRARLGEGRPALVGKVFLVGAGPGDPGLLTLKAADLLASADVVVYDRLVAPAILERARRDAERIAVGKAKGCHSATQEEINHILLEQARAGKRVVRLKGGDPFVFGRGGEELQFLRAHGVAVRVVPGVSAALGCAAAAGLPLTQRGVAEKLTFVSGHGRSGKPELDWERLAALDGTLVVFMAVSVAGTVAGNLIACGRSPETPVAVIENGTRPNERRAFGTLDGLEALVRVHDITGPAIIVIGEAAALGAPRRAMVAGADDDPVSKGGSDDA